MSHCSCKDTLLLNLFNVISQFCEHHKQNSIHQHCTEVEPDVRETNSSITRRIKSTALLYTIWGKWKIEEIEERSNRRNMDIEEHHFMCNYTTLNVKTVWNMLSIRFFVYLLTSQEEQSFLSGLDHHETSAPPPHNSFSSFHSMYRMHFW